MPCTGIEPVILSLLVIRFTTKPTGLPLDGGGDRANAGYEAEGKEIAARGSVGSLRVPYEGKR